MSRNCRWLSASSGSPQSAGGVLEDAGQPGLERGFSGKAATGERRQQRFLHDILGECLVSQLQPGDAQEVTAVRFELGGKVGNGHEGAQRERLAS
jgi:hypothetical protein